MASAAIELVRRQVRRLGFDVQRFPDPGPLAYYFKTLRIDTILDVGANDGAYGRSVRQMGFTGRIISFEPLSQPFAVLQAGAEKDGNWDCHRCALGDVTTELEMTVTESTVFSSFLPIRPFVHGIQPTSRPCRVESIPVRTLDDMFAGLALHDQNLWLKVDTQGFELQVLSGAHNSLAHVRAVQLEMSLRPLYDGQPTFETTIAYMRERGFVVSDLMRGFCNGRCGELIEIDGVFVRP